MKKSIKKYQLWHYSDGGYHLKEFDDLNDLPNLISDVYTADFYITHKLDITIEELTKEGE